MVSRDIISEVVKRLVKVLSPERIFLFGSQARGDARDNSDIDILVILKESSLPMHRRGEIAYRSLWGISASVDVIVYTHDEFTRGATVVTSLPASVIKEGRVVYAKES